MAMVSVSFSFQTQYGEFSDAIWYDDAAPMSDADIEAEKQRRLASWVNAIENPPAPPPARTITIGLDTYTLVLGTPDPGSVLIQVDNAWYQKV